MSEPKFGEFKKTVPLTVYNAVLAKVTGLELRAKKAERRCDAQTRRAVIYEAELSHQIERTNSEKLRADEAEDRSARVGKAELERLAVGAINLAKAETQSAVAESSLLRRALEDVWAAVGDRLCGGKPLSKEYGKSVLSTITSVLHMPGPGNALHEAVQELDDAMEREHVTASGHKETDAALAILRAVVRLDKNGAQQARERLDSIQYLARLEERSYEAKVRRQNAKRQALRKTRGKK